MTASRILGRAFLFLMAGVVLFPVFWTLLSAFKQNVDLLTPTPKLFFTPTLDNIAYVLGRPSVLQALINSLIICGVSVLIGIVLGLPAAYAVARYPNRWTDEIQFFVLRIVAAVPAAGGSRHSADGDLAELGPL